MTSRMPERARTDPWEPQGSNPQGPRPARNSYPRELGVGFLACLGFGEDLRCTWVEGSPRRKATNWGVSRFGPGPSSHPLTGQKLKHVMKTHHIVGELNYLILDAAESTEHDRKHEPSRKLAVPRLPHRTGPDFRLVSGHCMGLRRASKHRIHRRSTSHESQLSGRSAMLAGSRTARQSTKPFKHSLQQPTATC